MDRANEGLFTQFAVYTLQHCRNRHAKNQRNIY